MDDIEFAQQREQADRDLAIRAEREKPDPTPPNGHCYYCAGEVPGEDRFCDEDCRIDFERIMWAETQRAQP